MPVHYDIDIDGPIGGWGYSKDYVKAVLDNLEGQPVNIRINSLGGSLDDALDIEDRLRSHGQVTAYLCGFVASAATLITLGCQKVVMSSSAFYLIHKVSNLVDIYATMNADEMATAIEGLEKNRRENAKMDLAIAKLYAKKTGKAVDEIMPLLQTGEWLSADEALELGLVDEVVDSELNNPDAIAARLNAFHLPPRPYHGVTAARRLLPDMLKPKQTDMSGFLNARECLGVESLTLKNDTFILTLPQMEQIEARLEDLKSQVNEALATIAKQTEELEAMRQAPADTLTDQRPQAESRPTSRQLYNEVARFL